MCVDRLPGRTRATIGCGRRVSEQPTVCRRHLSLVGAGEELGRGDEAAEGADVLEQTEQGEVERPAESQVDAGEPGEQLWRDGTVGEPARRIEAPVAVQRSVEVVEEPVGVGEVVGDVVERPDGEGGIGVGIVLPDVAEQLYHRVRVCSVAAKSEDAMLLV